MTAITQARSVTFDDAPQELQLGVSEFWPQSEWDNAVRISLLESGWSAFAENDTRSQTNPCGSVLRYKDGLAILAEWSIGWFQINVCTMDPSWDARRLFNTRENCGTAHALWAERGWKPWLISAGELSLL